MTEPGSWAEARERVDGSAESLRKSAAALREQVAQESEILRKIHAAESRGGLTEFITWIPVAERLPDTEGTMLVCHWRVWTATAFYNEGAKRWYYDSQSHREKEPLAYNTARTLLSAPKGVER